MPTKISPVGSSISGGGGVSPSTPSTFTEGSVIFAGAATLAQNNAAFFWNDTTASLRLRSSLIGSSATGVLDIASTDADYGAAIIGRWNTSTESWRISGQYHNQGMFLATPPTGFIDIGGALDISPKLRVQGYAYESGGTAALVRTVETTTVGVAVGLAASQTANAFQVLSSASAVLMAILAGGGIQPASMADGSAPNNSIYYSTTASKLVYKDSGGVVNNLY